MPIGDGDDGDEDPDVAAAGSMGDGGAASVLDGDGDDVAGVGDVELMRVAWRTVGAIAQRVVTSDDPPTVGSDRAPVAELVPSHPTQIVCTSGTSGRPKGAIQTAGLIHGMTGLAQRVGLTEQDRLLTSSPMFHGLGQSWFQYSLAIGSTVIIAPRFSAARFWDDCRTYGVTAMQHVGAILSFLLQKPPTEFDRDHTVRFSFGVGAPEPVWRAFQDRFGVQIAEFYGMTEIGLATFNDLGGRIGSVGTLSGGVNMRLVDDEGDDVGDDEPGEAWTRPINVFGKHPDYFRERDATAAAISDGWFHTGDLLRRDADGWYWFVGRKRDSLRRRGENIVADDIERSVVALDAIADCAAVGAPSDHGDDEIRLCLVLADSSVSLDQPALIELAEEIRKALPAAMQPTFISFYERLPYTATNKLQRAQLRTDGLPVWDVRAQDWVTRSEAQ